MELDALVIGAGLSGIASAYHLAKLGLRFKVLEANSGEGGTWFWNRYPGCRFDSESWSYGFSFSREVLNEWAWSEHFSAQRETLRYARFLTERLDLRRYMQFDTTVVSAHFQQESRSWLITDASGLTYAARFLITATGVLGRPTLPNIRGLTDFQGQAFHTAHWPADLDISGKRVGIIGTGASGIQVIQSIAKTDIASLTVFQRTANWSAPLRNSSISDQEMEHIRERYDQIFEKCDSTHFSFIHSADPRRTFDVPEDERLDFWEELYAKPGFAKWLGNFEDVNSDKAANAAYSNFIADKIRKRVRDPETAEKLIPRDHGFGTKRVPLETNYFEAYNEPHIRLIDTINEASIECITKEGVELSTGEHINLDILVYATGFDAVTGPFSHVDFRGLDGVQLSEVWSGKLLTYLGIFVPHFPNFMMIMGPHQMFGNLTRGVELATSWVAGFIRFCNERGFTYTEASHETAEQWTQHVHATAKGLLLNEVSPDRIGTNMTHGKYHEILLRYNGPAPQFRRKCLDIAAEQYRDLRLD